jgi:hypothetical protein
MSGPRIVLPPFRGAVDGEIRSPDLEAALGRLPELASGPGAEVLHSGRNRIVALDLPVSAGRALSCVVKSFRSAGLQKLKTLVLPSKAAKAWRGARALAAAGFETPRPVAYLERRRGGLVAESHFVAERVPGLPEIRSLLRDPAPDGLRPLLAALAASVAALHRSGLLHRDLSDGNVLVRREGGAYSFVYLDTNRVRTRKRLGRFSRAKNLVRLGIAPADRAFFLERYAEARGEKPGPVFARLYRTAKSSFTAWLRIKKALRLKKAARALRIQ